MLAYGLGTLVTVGNVFCLRKPVVAQKSIYPIFALHNILPPLGSVHKPMNCQYVLVGIYPPTSAHPQASVCAGDLRAFRG